MRLSAPDGNVVGLPVPDFFVVSCGKGWRGGPLKRAPNAVRLLRVVARQH